MKKLTAWQIVLLVIFWPVGIVYLLIRALKKPSVEAQLQSNEYVSPRERYAKGTVFVYPGSTVYHTDYYCSQSTENDPATISEQEALSQNLRKCKKCTEYTCY